LKKDAKVDAIRYWWDKAVESLKAARRDLAVILFLLRSTAPIMLFSTL
jgi:hypothetical protein